MNKEATVQKFGIKKSRKKITLKLPDNLKCFDDCLLEIIEYDNVQQNFIVMFVVKDNVDIDNETIYMGLKDSFKIGIKKLVNRLTESKTQLLLQEAPKEAKVVEAQSS